MLAAGNVSFAKLNWKDILYPEGRCFGFERPKVLEMWCDTGSKEGSEISTRI